MRKRCVRPRADIVNLAKFESARPAVYLPHNTMIVGMKMEGLKRFNRICVSGSDSEYEMKKMVKVSLYSLLVRFKSSWSPSIFAFPILVRSRKEIR